MRWKLKKMKFLSDLIWDQANCLLAARSAPTASSLWSGNLLTRVSTSWTSRSTSLLLEGDGVTGRQSLFEVVVGKFFWNFLKFFFNFFWKFWNFLIFVKKIWNFFEIFLKFFSNQKNMFRVGGAGKLFLRFLCPTALWMTSAGACWRVII